MTEAKLRFEQYLESLEVEDLPRLMHKFEHYYQLLSSMNRQVNLVSRHIPAERFWIQHFLDSLLILECLDIKEKTLLDFGSGGGLPGIPLKLVVPSCSVTLLDSVQKKTRVLLEFVEAMALGKTMVETARLEDYAFLARRPSFDYIVCRAVALEERYLSPLRRLMKPSGMVVFYKSQKLDDLQALKHEVLWEKTDPDMRLRRFIGIKQRDLMLH